MFTYWNKTSSRNAIMAIASIVMLTVTSITEAAIFPTINTGTPPDITSAFIDTSYDAGTDVFSATGFAVTYLHSGGTTNLQGAPGSFFLTANIDATGFMSGGSLIIDLDGNSGGATPLLTGDLTMFQAGAAGDAFEFIFDVTGGDLAAVFGSTGGVILSNPGYGGNFSTDFTSTFQMSDTATVVPVPAAAWLFLSGLVGLGVRARRQA